MPRIELLKRGVVLVVALAALVWLVVSLTDWRKVTDASALIYARQPSRVTLAREIADLKRAKLFRPGDQRPDIVRSELLFIDRRQAQSIALLEQVVRREPQNLSAWDALAGFTQSDRRIFETASKHIRQLDPLSARR